MDSEMEMPLQQQQQYDQVHGQQMHIQQLPLMQSQPFDGALQQQFGGMLPQPALPMHFADLQQGQMYEASKLYHQQLPPRAGQLYPYVNYVPSSSMHLASYSQLAEGDMEEAAENGSGTPTDVREAPYFPHGGHATTGTPSQTGHGPATPINDPRWPKDISSLTQTSSRNSNRLFAPPGADHQEGGAPDLVARHVGERDEPSVMHDGGAMMRADSADFRKGERDGVNAMGSSQHTMHSTAPTGHRRNNSNVSEPRPVHTPHYRASQHMQSAVHHDLRSHLPDPSMSHPFGISGYVSPMLNSLTQSMTELQRQNSVLWAQNAALKNLVEQLMRDKEALKMQHLHETFELRVDVAIYRRLHGPLEASDGREPSGRAR